MRDEVCREHTRENERKNEINGTSSCHTEPNAPSVSIRRSFPAQARRRVFHRTVPYFVVHHAEPMRLVHGKGMCCVTLGRHGGAVGVNPGLEALLGREGSRHVAQGVCCYTHKRLKHLMKTISHHPTPSWADSHMLIWPKYLLCVPRANVLYAKVRMKNARQSSQKLSTYMQRVRRLL